MKQILTFPNFQPKKSLKTTIFLFHKKQSGKNFFLLKN
jgi:hypothetical protein